MNESFLKRAGTGLLRTWDRARDARKMSGGRRRAARRSCSVERLEARVVLDASLVISEFMAVNTEIIANDRRVLRDEDGSSSDWIEIFNGGTESVNLDGWHLSDNIGNLDKWTFPEVSMSPGDYLVVFASNKDRSESGAELHTNFKLGSDGEYLALVRPDDTVEFAFDPTFPPQINNVSYGLPNESTVETPLSFGASGKMVIPTDDSLDPEPGPGVVPAWAAFGFDDTSWQDVTTGIGFETDSTDIGAGTIVADSEADFSVTNTNAFGWNYGYWDKGSASDSSYQVDDFTKFKWTGLPFITSTNHWDAANSRWALSSRGSPETELNATGGHPAGDTDAGSEVHSPIRRWTSDIDAAVRLRGTLANPDATGDGVLGRVLVDGEEVYRQTVNGESIDYSFTTTVTVGTVIDFIIDAGPGRDDAGDVATFTGVIEELDIAPPPNLADSFRTDIESQLFESGTSAFLRVPFVIDDPNSIDSLSLNLKYDAGFVAYLNGVEVARANIQNEPAWDSTATVERSDGEARVAAAIDLTEFVGVLQTGENVLALHGVNSSATDSDFLLAPELIARQVTLDVENPRFFLVPTPGEANGLGTNSIGPIVAGVSHTPNVPLAQQDIIVTATVAKTIEPITSVDLHYRVMFGGTTTIPMFDDGLHGDGAAGDSVYGATIPGRAARAGQMVRYFITATDGVNDLSRAPLFENSRDSEEYFGTVIADPSTESDIPVIQWFIQNPGSATTTSGGRGSLFFDGDFYDNIFTNRHGQSTGGFPKKSYNFDFNKDHRFRLADGLPLMKDLDILTNYADPAKIRTTLSYEVFRAAGVKNHLAFPVRIHQNGEFFSVAEFVEDADDRWLERLGLDPNNALYKLYNILDSVGGGQKKTRKFEGKSDLQDLINGSNLSGNASTLFLYDNIDLPAMANYLAAMTLTSNQDCCHKNYYAYRDTNGTGEWSYFPWDVDLTWGRNWGGGGRAYFDDTIFSTTPPFLYGNNRLIGKLYANAEFSQMYTRRLRTLMDEILQPAGTPYEDRVLEASIDQWFDTFKTDADLDNATWNHNWGQRGKQSFEQAINELKDVHLEPHRTFLYRQSRIPDAQPANAMLQFGEINFRPASGNQNEEYIRISNRNPFAMDISNWTLEGDVSMTFKPGTVIPSGGTMYVSPDVNTFRARASGPSGGQGLFVQGNYDGHLQARGSTLIIRDKTGRLAATIDFEGNPSAPQESLRISEIMYNPVAPQGNLFAPSDLEYVELVNIGSETIDLTGVRFTEGIEFSFAGSNVPSLAPGQYALVVKSQQAFESVHSTDGLNIAGEFLGQLDNGGEKLRLEDSFNEVIHDFKYNDSWYEVTDGVGFSLHIVDTAATDPRDWDQATSWQPSRNLDGSPGADDPGGLPSPGAVVINEIMTNSGQTDGDWIELFNTTDEAVDIGSWFLSDDQDQSRLTRYQIPAGTIIGPVAYLVFSEATHFGKVVDPVNGFGLRSAGERVLLTAGDEQRNLLGYQEKVVFGGSARGESFGRFTNSTGDVHFVAQSTATAAAENAGPRIGPVVINEIHYNPSGTDVEFIEIFNNSDAPVPLFDGAETWQFDGGIDFIFPGGITLPAGGYAVVTAGDPVIFREDNNIPAEVPVLGPYAGQLDNGGEQIQLSAPNGTGAFYTVEQIKYNDKSPWPLLPDGTGPSLSRTDADLYGNDPETWSTSIPGGTPGVVNLLFDETPATIPTNIQVQLLDGLAVKVTWNESSDAQSGISEYAIYRNGRFFDVTTELQFIDTLISINEDFNYQITSINGSSVESGRSAAAGLRVFDVVTTEAFSGNQVRVFFSETVSQASAENVANYEIAAGAITVTGATLEVGGDSVLLTTAETLIDGQPYRVAASAISGSGIGVLLPGANAVFVPGVVSGGVSGEYFNNIDLSGDPVLKRIDSGINFNWGSGSPDPTINADNFSARWIGSITPEFGEEYQFRVLADDTARVWVNEVLVIDTFTNPGTTTGDIDLSLFAGKPIPFQLEFAETTGNARMQLAWKSPSRQLSIIVASAFSTSTDLETEAPTVTAIQVRGSEWTPEFIAAVDAAGLGSGGIDIPTGANPVTWPIDQISITFDEDMKVETADLIVPGHTIASVDYDISTFTAVWTLAQPATAENLQIQLAAGLTDLAGNFVDGDPNAGVVSVLAGDVDGSGLVDNADIRDVMRNQFARAGDAQYSLSHDLNADGIVNFIDLIVSRDFLGGAIPAAGPSFIGPPIVIGDTIDTALDLETSSNREFGNGRNAVASRLVKATLSESGSNVATDEAIIDFTESSNENGGGPLRSRLLRAVRSRVGSKRLGDGLFD